MCLKTKSSSFSFHQDRIRKTIRYICNLKPEQNEKNNFEIYSRVFLAVIFLLSSCTSAYKVTKSEGTMVAIDLLLGCEPGC